ncbi:hypothetical protein SLEP1_g24486 [Rubroshorea leprosula]|uniref:Uncharacterized protein n=1 Tax=Rubroshorea leprosula TaxID=152421 RepID=A0AAV5JQ48_9ROSI|nr:hypothetical protein SLEP1_g24486 [Rubroshorea leprosula]
MAPTSSPCQLWFACWNSGAQNWVPRRNPNWVPRGEPRSGFPRRNPVSGFLAWNPVRVPARGTQNWVPREDGEDDAEDEGRKKKKMPFM